MAKKIVELKNVTVRFNLAAKKKHSLKQYLAAIAHRELMFQEFLALKDVDLTIRQGESWGFVGKNGSGKSTLLKVVTGILRPYTGTVNVTGSVAPLLELGAGFDPELTGRENIYMNGLLLGMSNNDIRKHFDEIVDFSELEKFLDVPLKNYSSGMKSRLGFSIATTARADILIADEVLATGDKAFHAKCERRMRGLLNNGTTLLFVSHSLPAVRKMCNKAMWLDSGTVRMSGDAAPILSAYDEWATAKK